MEVQGAYNNQNTLEIGEQSWKACTSQIKNLKQSYSYQDRGTDMKIAILINQ